MRCGFGDSGTCSENLFIDLSKINFKVSDNVADDAGKTFLSKLIDNLKIYFNSLTSTTVCNNHKLKFVQYLVNQIVESQLDTLTYLMKSPYALLDILKSYGFWFGIGFQMLKGYLTGSSYGLTDPVVISTIGQILSAINFDNSSVNNLAINYYSSNSTKLYGDYSYLSTQITSPVFGKGRSVNSSRRLSGKSGLRFRNKSNRMRAKGCKTKAIRIGCKKANF